MDLELSALFVDEVGTATEPKPAASSPPLYRPHHGAAVRASADQYKMGGVNLSQDNLAGGPVIDSGLPFGMQVDTYAEDTIKSLLRERDLMKEEVAQQKKAYEDLEQRVCKRAAVDINLPAEVARRVKRLENEVERCRTENEDLRIGLKAAQSQVVNLQDEIAGQKNKLKGASKKVGNARDVAGKEEEKTKSAVHDKQLQLFSERKMRQERNEVAAEKSRLAKLCIDLQRELEVERAGEPHLRERPCIRRCYRNPTGGGLYRAGALSEAVPSLQVQPTQYH
jgi:hypothetical protein